MPSPISSSCSSSASSTSARPSNSQKVRKQKNTPTRINKPLPLLGSDEEEQEQFRSELEHLINQVLRMVEVDLLIDLSKYKIADQIQGELHHFCGGCVVCQIRGPSPLLLEAVD